MTLLFTFFLDTQGVIWNNHFTEKQLSIQYAGLELEEGKPEIRQLIEHLKARYGWAVRTDSSLGLKPSSRAASGRLVKAAIDYVFYHHRTSVTFVHKGNFQKYTEAAFRRRGYEMARAQFSDKTVAWDE